MVECALGILKAKFPCLNFLRLKSPVDCGRVILACITLHNIEIITHNNDRSFEMDLGNGFISQQFTSAEDVMDDIVALFEAETN